MADILWLPHTRTHVQTHQCAHTHVHKHARTHTLQIHMKDTGTQTVYTLLLLCSAGFCFNYQKYQEFSYGFLTK